MNFLINGMYVDYISKLAQKFLPWIMFSKSLYPSRHPTSHLFCVLKILETMFIIELFCEREIMWIILNLILYLEVSSFAAKLVMYRGNEIHQSCLWLKWRELRSGNYIWKIQHVDDTAFSIRKHKSRLRESLKKKKHF